ncbi:MAG: YjbQ family protein [Gammaproteobacteria bacterium]|nr:YjbQ family protein [Gammaproteobacteria bacterium]
MYEQETITIASRGRGTYRIDDDITRIVAGSGVITGLCHVFCHHTSASLILCENADPTVRRDLETFMARLVPDGDAMFDHDAEGPDDMPAHVRSILTQSSLDVPVTGGLLSLGTWQGIYLWEHRTSSHRRQVTITVHGATR